MEPLRRDGIASPQRASPKGTSTIEPLRNGARSRPSAKGGGSRGQRPEAIRCGALLDVPGILLTGSIRPDRANRVRARDIGCAAFVAKPCIPITSRRSSTR